MGIIRTICISKKKGTAKTPAKGSDRLIEGFGIEGDAHAGRWHRQISLLSYESIQDFKARGAQVRDGSFGENLITEGIRSVKAFRRNFAQSRRSTAASDADR